MSLLKKASIITTPTAYAEDYLYSIKPAYALGSELVTNGNFANGTTNWTANSSTLSVVDNSLKVVSTAGFGNAEQNITVVGGQTYEIKADFIYGGSVEGRLNAYDGSASPVEVGSTSNTNLSFKIKITAGQTNLRIRVVNQSSSTSVYNNWDNVSIKLVTDADFDFDRNSTGTRVNEDYLIEDVPYNLITRSEDFSHGAYTKYQASIAETTIQSPISGSYVESISNTNTGTTYSFISQNLAAPDREANITLSVYAKKGTYNRLGISSRSGDTFGAIYDLENATVVDTHPNTGHILASSIQSAGNDFYLCSITVVKSVQYNIHPIPNNISDAELLLSTLSYTEVGNVNIFGAQLVKGNKPKPYLKTTDRLDIPRIDYTNGEPSILLEPSRTNLFEYDIDFSQSVWTKGNVTLQSNTAISPEGLQNASNIYPTTNVAYIYNTTTASSSVYTVSAYVKANGKNVAWLYSNSGSTNGTIYFDLSDESMQVVAGSAGTPTGTITKMPNGWYRITFTTGTAISLTGGSGVGVSDAKGSLNATQNGTDGILVYGLQLEAGSYPTSLIHTSGSAVTRSADLADNAGNSDLINSTEGVLYVEASSVYNSSITNRIAISDGTNSNRIVLEWDETTENRIRVHINTHSLLSYDAVDLSTQNKVAIKYAANDYALWFNGQEVLTQASGALPTGMDVLELTGAGLGGIPEYRFYGNVKMVAVFKEALTDLELEKLTGYNNHELYMNYYNRLSYLGLAEEYNVESDINNYIL